MRVLTAEQGNLYVNSVSKLANGSDVEGYLYFTQAGIHNSTVQFQRGPVATNGVNGVTPECLLVILLHRAKHLNSLVSCPEAELDIAALQTMLDRLQVRTTKA